MSMTQLTQPPDKPIVFLGPSLPLDEARQVLDARYCPPAARGDFEQLAPGSFVALIDGVFDQNRAVSPRELLEAAGRGVHIVAGGSMGALRAAEVPNLHGVGHIFDMYRSGRIRRDDEVALVFCPRTYRGLTVPLVNTRYAIERLVASGTLDRELGKLIVDAAAALHFTERTYERILEHAGLAERVDAPDLIALLNACDLKREDAQSALEALARLTRAPVSELPQPRAAATPADLQAAVRVPESFAADAPLLVWEYGDAIRWRELLCFLHMTGRFQYYARNAVARYVLAGNPLDQPSPLQPDDAGLAAQRVFETIRVSWGWECEDEAHLTMCDLGLGLHDTSEVCHDEVSAQRALDSVIADDSPELQRALRAELLMNDLALKRELLRYGSLRALASSACGDATGSELEQARAVLCRANGQPSWAWLTRALKVPAEERDAFVAQLTAARRAARELRIRERPLAAPVTSSAPFWQLQPAPKAPGDLRFSSVSAHGLSVTRQLQQLIGITRIGFIGELSDMAVQVGQAARPTGRWSSTYGSGKSETVEGAEIGSVMEEAEKWAQEQFAPERSTLVRGTTSELASRHFSVDPQMLDLPYDSVYHPAQALDWYECYDILNRKPVLVPIDALTHRRQADDIYFSVRGARKVFSSNGLASGFNLEEAILHAVCECIERHARKRADMIVNNPGLAGHRPYARVDLSSCGASVQTLVARLQPKGRVVRVLDITSEIDVPTYWAVVEEIESGVRAPGWGCHPNPEVAIRMALLEAAQSAIISIAGGREDLLIQVRSLGRHEGARPRRAEAWWYWADPDRETTTLEARRGLVSADIFSDLVWVLQALERADVASVAVVDLTQKDMTPARAVRVVIPGLDTTNPFHCSQRLRASVNPELLRWR